MTHPALARARRFLLAEGRLLERRMAEVLFDGADASVALHALLAYRNADGGFGHALEPDKRTASSQPLDVEMALQVMEDVGGADRAVVLAACDYLQRMGSAVGCLTAGALEDPHAPHWGAFAFEPSLNPTAGIVARLWRWDIAHPWRDGATDFCWKALEEALPTDAHSFGEVLKFLDVVHDRDRAEAYVAQLSDLVPNLSLFRLDPDAEGYGLTPLHLAPEPSSRWAALFGDAVIERHLVALGRAQEEDGGWPISWETVGPASLQEWRGIETLRSLRTLGAYGRLG